MIKKNFLKKNIINCNSFLFQALQKLNKNDIKILFVKEKKKIVGTLTDGDIRRILLKENHTKISINHKYNKKFLFFLEKNFNFRKANKIMSKKQIFAAPILSHKGELKDLYFLNQSTQKKINADVFILAGGLGKRMGPLTAYNPKPMLLLGGKPILESIIYSFKEFGMSNWMTAQQSTCALNPLLRSVAGRLRSRMRLVSDRWSIKTKLK
jgi:CBS domain-containing protein